MLRRSTVTRLGLVSLSSALAVAGCAGNPTQPTHPLGQPFDLRAGTSSNLQEGLTIRFDRVTSDSRCPIDVNCVWAGDAVVVLTLSQRSENRAERELHTAIGGSEASYLRYTITLAALAPSRRSNQPIAPGDYVATLTVKAR